ncbi:glycerol-3-phosphate dehydrogenase/oxidase [Hazenella coriacea]|uniref:Glycerol-3-phosphate dehydrogenase n=1 Tax=Hazenella coriacea TaxID=1179467 RepID=A0A4V6NZ80_9BACL|nr:glycerol-3-phosphate dehydrogenase/oxidase [Hazenella coriacea]TCS93677.1 homodimeric glycerol 3-phosphate dehydrogenase (quinone) [Hazenella coriacea]
MKTAFTIKQRSKQWSSLKSCQVDLLVIGGGITGAGIALDAQTRGINTILIEMQDFAAGTSSRSTKLVHGGLRYLKQLEFSMVAEVGKERAIVYENGPHVTQPEWMLLPIIEGGTYGKWASSFGIRLYDYLAGVKKSERRQMLNREQTLEKEPLLRKKGLKGSGYYVEYRTDDARLTIEILKRAVEKGVQAFNYTKAEEFIYSQGKLVGVQVKDCLSGESFPVYAKKVVNATGPWVDLLREKDGSKKGKYLHWTKGVHIVVDQHRFSLRQSIYFDTSDGRMVFAIPREGKTYIGTTDTDYYEDLEHPRVTEQDRNYLLQAVNDMFPSIKLTSEDVESSWAGIRPLIHEEGKSPSEISRKDEIFYSKSGLITIAGGKLTGYRKMAEKVTDLVVKELSREEQRTFKPIQTASIPISGGDVGGSKQFPRFVAQKIAEGVVLGLKQENVRKLVHRYGTNVDDVFEIIRTGRTEAETYQLSLEIYGALLYGLQHEMVATPADFFIRRTGAIYFEIDKVKKWQIPVIQLMKDYFEWDESRTDAYTRDLEKQIIFATKVVSSDEKL